MEKIKFIPKLQLLQEFHYIDQRIKLSSLVLSLILSHHHHHQLLDHVLLLVLLPLHLHHHEVWLLVHFLLLQYLFTVRIILNLKAPLLKLNPLVGNDGCSKTPFLSAFLKES